MAATTTARSRGIGITSKDMEASRLVFVFVRDSKPRRKVAVPVPDSYTWEQFLDQVKLKLKLTGVGDIYLSSSGQRVKRVSELQDIDELCVVEAASDAVSNGVSSFSVEVGQQPGTSTSEIAPQSDGAAIRQQANMLDRHRSSALASGALAPAASTSDSLADEADHKYVRRTNPIKRTLQRLLPGLFAPGLPVTMRDAQSDTPDLKGAGSLRSRRRSKRATSGFSTWNIIMVLVMLGCVGTMLFMFTKVQQVQLATQQAASTGGGTGAGPGAGSVGSVGVAATNVAGGKGGGSGVAVGGSAKAPV